MKKVKQNKKTISESTKESITTYGRHMILSDMKQIQRLGIDPLTQRKLSKNQVGS